MIMAHPTSTEDISMTINLPVVAVTETAARLESTKEQIVEILKNPAPNESDLAGKRSIPESTEQRAQKKSEKLASRSKSKEK